MSGAIDGEKGDVFWLPVPVDFFFDHTAKDETERLDDVCPADELDESLEDRRGYA